MENGGEGDGLGLDDVLSKLPQAEARHLVFGRLDLDSKLTARLVCRSWLEFVQPLIKMSPIFWDSSVPEVLKLAESGLPIETLKISKLQEFVYPEEGVGFGVVRSLDLKPCEDQYGKLHGISQENLFRVFGELGDSVEELHLNSRALLTLEIPSPLSTCNLPELKMLQISSATREGVGHEACCEVLGNNFPSLEHFDCTLISDDDEDEGNGGGGVTPEPIKYAEVFEFISRHRKTLKTLCLGFLNMLDIYEEAFVETPEDHAIPNERFIEIKEELESLQLDFLEFSTIPFEGVARYTLGVTLLAAQKCLSKLEIFPIRSLEMLAVLPQVFSQCSETLKEVKVKGCICHHLRDVADFPFFPIPDPPVFDCSCLKAMKKLESFRLDICGSLISKIEHLPENIRTLALGPTLYQLQMEYIARNMSELRCLFLLQGKNLGILTFPTVSLDLFTSIIRNKPKFQKLVLRLGGFQSSIRDFVAETPGLGWEEYSTDPHSPYLNHIKVTVDRDTFSPSI